MCAVQTASEIWWEKALLPIDNVRAERVIDNRNWTKHDFFPPWKVNVIYTNKKFTNTQTLYSWYFWKIICTHLKQ